MRCKNPSAREQSGRGIGTLAERTCEQRRDSLLDPVCLVNHRPVLPTSGTRPVFELVRVVSDVPCREWMPSLPTFLIVRIVQPRIDRVTLKRKPKFVSNGICSIGDSGDLGTRQSCFSGAVENERKMPCFLGTHQQRLAFAAKEFRQTNFLGWKSEIFFTMVRGTG